MRLRPHFHDFHALIANQTENASPHLPLKEADNGSLHEGSKCQMRLGSNTIGMYNFF